MCVCVCVSECERPSFTPIHNNRLPSYPRILISTRLSVLRVFSEALVYQQPSHPTFQFLYLFFFWLSQFKHSVQALSRLYRLATRQFPTASLQSTRSNPKLAGSPQRLTQYVCSHPPCRHCVTTFRNPGSAVAFPDSNNTGLYANE